MINEVANHPVFPKFLANTDLIDELSGKGVGLLKVSSGGSHKGSFTSEDLGLSKELKSSLNVNHTKKHLDRIHKKLQNYRQCCIFFFKFFPNYGQLLAQNQPLEDLNIFVYYCLKLSYYKFSYLEYMLKKKQCPAKFLFSYDTDYWGDYINSTYFK